MVRVTVSVSSTIQRPRCRVRGTTIVVGASPSENSTGTVARRRSISGSPIFAVPRATIPCAISSSTASSSSAIPGAIDDGGAVLQVLDHLTHNVFNGNMDTWAGFYERVFNFREIRYFDIKGQHTGLLSRAMTGPCGKLRIPLNESSDDQSQIAEYLRDYNGEGIQHIALTTPDIYKTIEALRQTGLVFQDTPETYYELVDERVPGHGEDLERLKKNRILVDGDPEKGDGVLLQIFTTTNIGPIFFEIIQRKGNEGFGEGNFKALFESIELDQIRRGVIKTGAAGTA